MFLLPLPSSLLQLPNVQPLKEDHSFFPGMGNNNFEWQGVGGMANQKINYYFFLPFFVCIFSFNRIATEKTSRWVAAHTGQRYSLLFILIEDVLF